MPDASPDPVGQVQVPVDAIARTRPGPVVVALDGRSGVGKSTLARAIVASCGATLIEGDDFYAGGTPEDWDGIDAAAKAARCIDWRRQRVLLETLRRGEDATYQRFDWDAFDGRLDPTPLSATAHPIVILEGAYSARPELTDLLDLRVLVETANDTRRARLLEREGDEYRADWEGRWSEAEVHYFGTVVPRDEFDLVIWT